MHSAGVFGDVARLRVAVSFVQFGPRDWFTIAVRETQRPQTWTKMKEVICAGSSAVSESEEIQRVRRVLLVNSVFEDLTEVVHWKRGPGTTRGIFSGMLLYYERIGKRLRELQEDFLLLGFLDEILRSNQKPCS